MIYVTGRTEKYLLYFLGYIIFFCDVKYDLIFFGAEPVSP